MAGLRRYAPMKPSRGTVIPAQVRAAVWARDRWCVGPKVGMPGGCVGGIEIDHVRASGALGKKSESTAANTVLLCNWHHRDKTLHGRKWRPKLLAYIEERDRGGL